MYPGLLAAVQPEELSPIPRAERSAVVYTHMFLLTLGGPDQAGGLLLGTIKLLLFKPQLALRCLLGVISAFFCDYTCGTPSFVPWYDMYKRESTARGRQLMPYEKQMHETEKYVLERNGLKTRKKKRKKNCRENLK